MKIIKCSKCGDDIKSRVLKGMCEKCYQRVARDSKTKTYELPKKGEVKYSPDGLVICHICGKAYKKLMNHTWQIHGLTEKEYKLEFGLNATQGLICEETKQKMQIAVKKHYDKVVLNNLIEKGEKTRFFKGSEGRSKSKIRAQELNRLRSYAKKDGVKNLKYYTENGNINNSKNYLSANNCN